MIRYLAGAGAAFLVLTGGVLLWQSHAESAPNLPSAPEARPASAFLTPAGPLTAPEASEVETAEHQRNLSDCKAGRANCEYSKLTGPEAAAMASAEQLRNYRACLRDRKSVV